MVRHVHGVQVRKLILGEFVEHWMQSHFPSVSLKTADGFAQALHCDFRISFFADFWSRRIWTAGGHKAVLHHSAVHKFAERLTNEGRDQGWICTDREFKSAG